ncbi:hypothetical protein A33K_13574 [Burkholderia humptydooensis MSMB43]|uniref:Uncharacterized protein n=1 Tax=Burkholderia humptydooensis MSMB43 TaxID=441157 RepID=A0ABN0GD66_9BURK|nr:hypothetical protein A33K_13574 [Burkholderia humptydooensis MSMB43]
MNLFFPPLPAQAFLRYDGSTPEAAPPGRNRATCRFGQRARPSTRTRHDLGVSLPIP